MGLSKNEGVYVQNSSNYDRIINLCFFGLVGIPCSSVTGPFDCYFPSLNDFLDVLYFHGIDCDILLFSVHISKYNALNEWGR